MFRVGSFIAKEFAISSHDPGLEGLRDHDGVIRNIMVSRPGKSLNLFILLKN